MSRYKHNPAPSHRAQQFIEYCAERITEWRTGHVLVACGAFKRLHWVERADSLSPNVWVVCNRTQWEAAKSVVAQRAMARANAPKKGLVVAPQPQPKMQTPAPSWLRRVLSRVLAAFRLRLVPQ